MTNDVTDHSETKHTMFLGIASLDKTSGDAAARNDRRQMQSMSGGQGRPPETSRHPK